LQHQLALAAFNIEQLRARLAQPEMLDGVRVFAVRVADVKQAPLAELEPFSARTIRALGYRPHVIVASLHIVDAAIVLAESKQFAIA
jgi:hypothetical protein